MVHNVRILQVLAIVFTFVSWFMIIFIRVLGATPLSNFEETVVKSQLKTDRSDVYSELVTAIASLQSQYLLFYPYVIKIVIDCVVLFHNLFVLWDINLAPSNINITNYFALSRLSQISNMVLSPSSILGYR
jgi:hypothetical protein